MQRARRVGPLALCARLGWALGLIAGVAPVMAAPQARLVPVAASDARPSAPPRPAAASASAAIPVDPPGMASPQCDGLAGEVRRACIEHTARGPR